MEWDKEAADEFIKLPLAKSTKESTKVFAEKLARKNLGDRVTLRDIEAAKKVMYGGISEDELRRNIDKRVSEGETDLKQRLENEARDILEREIDLFKIDICPARSFNCRFPIFRPDELKKELEYKLRELKVSEMVADSHRDDEKIMAHHRVIISISGCPKGCSAPEARPFGIHGVSKPVITGATCSECFACIDECPKGAIVIRDGGPQIDSTRCDLCEYCVKACPTGTLESETKGYRIMVGGRFGRFHQLGTQLFRIADKETLINTIVASIRTIKEEAVGYEDINSIVNRVGVSPIFKRLYQD